MLQVNLSITTFDAQNKNKFYRFKITFSGVRWFLNGKAELNVKMG